MNGNCHSVSWGGGILKSDDSDALAFSYAERWCKNAGDGWSVEGMLGRGGTAPVFLLNGPKGPRALKLFDQHFCEGELGTQTARRIDRQVELGDHGCPHLIVCHDGGPFEGRLFLLMGRAEGQELEKRLIDLPRSKIRTIVNQVALAALFLRSQGLSHRDIKSANIFVSDDFERITVLDLSVMREIYDPIGLGTDHDNQLPVVATSRYTPPEYLFRLQAPSAELWHGVDVYQLGGVLHDLIMREPMFSAEYASSSENRYRFAWIVATIDPVVRADDVDTDLVLLARRALDKNWDRRRLLRLEDFLVDTQAHAVSLAAIGLSPVTRPIVDVAPGLQPAVARDLARSIEEGVLAHLRDRGLIATHSAQPNGDLDWRITWEWTMESADVARKVEFSIDLRLTPASPHARIECQTYIAIWLEGNPRQATLSLPFIPLSDGADDDLTRQIVASLGPLSASAFSVSKGEM